MADKRDYYEVLGIGRDADLSDIKKAYRRMALRYHPDKNPGDARAEERFKDAAEAYAVLSDPAKRGRYDQFGHAGLGGQPGFSGFDADVFADFGDILGEMFGGIFGGSRRRRDRGAAAGRDLRYDLEIEFEEAIRGMETRIQVPRLEVCSDCGGSGGDGPDAVQACGDCGGRGQVAFQQGFFTVARSCGRCRGSGRILVRPCRTCRGEGRVRRERTITVRIPPGVDDGVRLRISGEGEAGRGGGPPGDLYVFLRVAPHELFTRDGIDLDCEVELPFARAALGTEIQVPTLDGESKLEIPPGTQPGAVFRLAGRGAPELSGRGRGDLRVHVRVRVPRRLSAEQRQLLQRFDELDEEGAGLFERVKKIFG